LNSFFQQVYAVVGQIPSGSVVSYGQIARMMGRPRAAREVGRAMRYCPEELPWQRVVMADGSIKGGMSADMRKVLLKAEGVTFLKDGRVDMESCQFNLGDGVIGIAQCSRKPWRPLPQGRGKARGSLHPGSTRSGRPGSLSPYRYDPGVPSGD
jgi:methylated-DNA-protein-cysteine methyltransferase related protein